MTGSQTRRTGAKRRAARLSEVAEWHRRSGAPDDVTDEGEVVDAAPAQRAGSEKEQLRAAIARLRDGTLPDRAQTLARLAASYLVAGDVETARRYVASAQELLSKQGFPNTPPD